MDFISKKRKTVAPDKQIIVKDAQPAIITHEEYIAALP